MGLFRFLFKWSLQITGSLIIGYNYGLKPQQQADLYGLYRSCNNTYRAGREIYAALNEYKTLLQFKSNPEQYSKQLSQVNSNTAKRIEQLSRINRGVYMRLGQTIGFLKYAYPTEFYEILKELNQKPNYQPEDYKYLKTHIQSQLGKKTRELFESLNTSPIKTELFSQVYKGQLAENFLDVNLKVINPYAKNQAKWDLWFLKKAFGYINDFKQKNFSQSAYPLYLDQLYSNLEKNVEKELNFIEQQKETKFVKQKLEALIGEEKSKTIPRNLPIYVPHIYSQYTKEKVMIQEYFEGYHLSNSDALIKENYNKKSISSDLISTWNGLIEKHNLLLESFTPADLFIRKSRANEEGQYQICPLNLTKNQIVPEFFVKPYFSLWKDYISSKKINPKKPEQRINSIRSFYQNIAQVYFTLFLNDVKISNEVSLQYSLNPQSRAQLIEAAKQQLPKEMVNKMEANKLIPKSKTKVTVSSQSRNDYENLKRAFWIEFQPWKVQTLFETYKQIFREEKHFGVF